MSPDDKCGNRDTAGVQSYAAWRVHGYSSIATRMIASPDGEPRPIVMLGPFNRLPPSARGSSIAKLPPLTQRGAHSYGAMYIQRPPMSS